MDYTKRIQDLRKQNNMTLGEVADFIGVTEADYIEYEKDANHLPNRCWIKLSELYGVSVDYMLCITDNPKRS